MYSGYLPCGAFKCTFAVGPTMIYVLLVILLLTLIGTALVLRRYQTRYRAINGIYRNHPEPLVRVALASNRILECNEMFAQFLGYATPQECVSVDHWDQHLPQFNLELARKLKVRPEGFPYDLGTVDVVRLDGGQVRCVLSVSYLSPGNFVDLKLTQDCVDHQARTFNPLPFITLHPSLEVISANEAAVKVFGPKLEQGFEITGLIQADLRDRIIRIIRARQRHTNFSIPVPNILMSGECELFRWYFFRKGMEEIELTCLRLPEIPQDWRLLSGLLQAQASVWEFDYMQKKLVLAPEWIQFLGYDDQSSISHFEFWSQSVHPDDLDELMHQFQLLQNDQVEQVHLRFRIATVSGLELNVIGVGYVSVRLADGSPAKFRGIQILEQRREAEVQSELVHDLTNQFTSIRGFAQLINENADHQIAGYAKQIQLGAERANELLTGGKSNQAGVYAAINNVCDEMGIYSVVHRDRNTNIQTGVEVVEQALRILVNNASQANTSLDDIHVKTDFDHHGNEFCSSCGCSLAEPMLKISVENRSKGIYRGFMNKMLSSGFSVEDIVDGKGHELATLNNQIHDANGHITLSSSDHASQVSIFIPDAERELIRQVNGSKILVIDDEPLVSRYISEVLNGKGFDVTTLADPIAALKIFRAQPDKFDLVITDQKMPGMSGEMIVQEMHQIRPELPIIICSGYSDGVGNVMARDLGACGFIKKPIDVENLLTLVLSRLDVVEQAEY